MVTSAMYHWSMTSDCLWYWSHEWLTLPCKVTKRTSACNMHSCSMATLPGAKGSLSLPDLQEEFSTFKLVC